MARHPPHILELAKRGAELQLRDLVQEIRYLLDLFPHLRDSVSDEDLPVSFIIGREATRQAEQGPGRGRGRRGTRSPAAGKGTSTRSRKDWSARRETKKG
jgi:hypothetical protein